MARILVATDFSEPSDNAVLAATALGRRLGAQLHLLHSLPPEVTLPEAARLAERERAAAEARLEGLRIRIAGEGVACRSELTTLAPERAIVERAGALGCGLVVLGTRGRSGLEHVRMGSVAERTVRAAPCPVLTVGVLPDPAFPLKTILVALDFSDASRHALAVARELAQRAGPAQLLLLRARYAAADLQSLMGGRDPLPLRLEEVADDLEPVLIDLQKSGIASEYVVEAGFPEKVIVDVARRARADLIAMGTHGRSGLSHFFLGSVAERVLRSAPCPVLTARASASGEPR
jgi:nucleotide-binding universal stress UspA family protein